MSKKEKNSLVKWDNNFLEYSNWIVDSRGIIKSFYIETPHGKYEISTTEKADRLPDRVDKAILYYLLTYKQQNIKTTRYQISKNIFDEVGSHLYGKIMQALKRWISITIDFNGTFYQGGGHITKIFHIMDEATLQEDGKLHVRFNQSFFDQLERSNYTKYVDFNEFKKLRRPISAMLYEHLVKQFKGRDFWKIGIVKLAKKLTLNRAFPSQILIKLKPAIKEINNNTSLKFTMDYDKETHKCLFRLLGKDSKKDPSSGDSEELNRLLALLPEALKTQRSVKTLIHDHLKARGYNFAQSNIIYTLQNSKKNMKAFLKKALLNDYGEELRANSFAEEEKRRQEKEIEKNRAKKEALENELWDKVNGWIKKYGGKGKALYNGHVVVACNADFMAVQVGKNERKSFDLVEVREEWFKSPGK